MGQSQSLSGLSQVNIPDPTKPNECLIVHDKETLERACLEEAHQQFTQAAETPIVQLPLGHRLDSLGTRSTAFQQILNNK